jgi:hypothetical protein
MLTPGEDQMKSALVVLRSLNTNSKGIMALVFNRFVCGQVPTRARTHTRTHIMLTEWVLSAQRNLQIIKHQLGGSNTQGLTFAALYERCRENFLVSSEGALKSHLAELKDHKVVRERSAGVNAVGSRVLYAPLPPDTLRSIQTHLKASGLRPSLF